ncbi:hypothetical protein [Dictyobacter alpinus]|uniref:hypothetical protein n=1 Tax=Dictyobacter alpinus TaxID=2014873 RepID=UPI001386D255|nr:hypothetical protein [Dictyobacter alpinus]
MATPCVEVDLEYPHLPSFVRTNSSSMLSIMLPNLELQLIGNGGSMEMLPTLSS